MNHIPPYENDLITRYLSGEASPEDIAQLSSWLSEDPANAKVFEEYQKIWSDLDQHAVSGISIDDEWERFEKKIQADNIPAISARRTSFNYFLRIAAALIILLIPGYFVFHYLTIPAGMNLVASAGILEDQLPDGSFVTLNKGSSVAYVAKRGKERSVKLEGTAYFRVAHDNSRPFIVACDDMRVEVLGTSFMVSTPSGDGKLEVTLDTGKVALYKAGKDSERVFLEPGQKAVISGDQISVMKNDDRNYMSWKTKKLVFINDPLSLIVSEIEKMHGTRIRLSDPSIAGCRVTATFDHQTDESMLNVLKETLSLSLEKNSSGYVLSGNGCE
jgi:ferric-dicitrate binding protein FerR (iron transport regulator)